MQIKVRRQEVVYVSREYREGCMLKRNRYLVDHAACLLAVYNGERRGGTAMTVRYAGKLNRDIHIIDPNMPVRPPGQALGSEFNAVLISGTD